MDAVDQFTQITALICEPVRSRMLWRLLDGRAYTAGELALAADVSATSASNHLAKMLDGALLKVEIQGRHRYYSFARPEVAYVVESLASLSNLNSVQLEQKPARKPIQYCRTCYDHLAGYVGVLLTEALEQKGYLHKAGASYLVPERGWAWFATLDITEQQISSSRRALSRQCLDWSERRPHLAGALGAALLQKMMEKGWFRKVEFSRELVVTAKGRQQISILLSLNI